LRVANTNYYTSSFAAMLIQMRRFVSLPNSKDQRPSILRTTTTATAALLYAAEEADRLLVQSAKHQRYYESKLNGTSSVAVFSAVGQDELIQKEVMEAANTLLIVSNDPALQAMIASGANSEHAQHITVLHRAFLALTTKCLDCIRIIQPTASTEHVYALLDPALALARRAHDLGLPFHLPLYQRLMEVTAVTIDTTPTTRGPDVILEIASYTDTLNAFPVAASLFRPALVALIQARKFVETVELMQGMRDRHGLAIVDRQTATDMYVRLHAVTKESFCLRSESRRDLPESPVTEIVAMLEPSVLLFSIALEKEAKEDEETLNQLLENIDDQELDRVYEAEEDNEDEDFDSDDDYDDEDADTMQSSKIDPLDQAVNHIITKRVKDEKAKAVFAELVNVAAKPTIPRIITMRVELESDLEYWADDSDSLSESEEEEVNRRHDSQRNRFHFPDVKNQGVSTTRVTCRILVRRLTLCSTLAPH
jgi:hypothetical protein